MSVVGSSMVDAENQTEFDTTMTVRALGDLERQGLPESYENSVEKELVHISTGTHPLGALPVSSNDYSQTPLYVDDVVSVSFNGGFVSTECIVEGNVTRNYCALNAPIVNDDQAVSILKDVESVGIIKDQDSASIIKDAESAYITTSCILHLNSRNVIVNN